MTLPRSGYHCRFKNTLHCQILNRQWHTGSDRGWHHCPFLKTDTNLQATVSVPGSTRQCLVEQHCRFVDPTDSDVCLKSVGSWLKSAVLSKPTLSACVSSRQCWASHHRWFMAQAGCVGWAITVGWWLKPTLLSPATLPIWISSQ